MKKKYPVILSDTERDDLKRLIASGTAPARKLTHARILLKADEGAEGAGWVDEKVAEAVKTSQPTVARIRRQYFEEGVSPQTRRRGGGAPCRAGLLRAAGGRGPLELATARRQAR